MLKPYHCFTLAVFLLFSLLAPPAWAVQTHGGAEGLVSHQVGHFLFVIGIGYLVYRLNYLKMSGPGWREFKLFLCLLLIWNVLTFSGHLLDEVVDRTAFEKANGALISFRVDGFIDLVYYLSRLDHLVLVPAFVCFLLALRKWSRQQ